MKAVVAAFNQEEALVGAFSVITNLRMELFEALILTLLRGHTRGAAALAHCLVHSGQSRVSSTTCYRGNKPSTFDRDRGWIINQNYVFNLIKKSQESKVAAIVSSGVWCELFDVRKSVLKELRPDHIHIFNCNFVKDKQQARIPQVLEESLPYLPVPHFISAPT